MKNYLTLYRKKPKECKIYDLTSGGYQFLWELARWSEDNFYYWCNKKLSLNLGSQSIKVIWLLFIMATRYSYWWDDEANQWRKEK